jgi:hypothetical protein
MKITNEDIDKKLEGRNIKRLDDYVNNKTKIKFQCLKKDCNHIWITTTNSIISGRTNCPKCTNHLELTNEIIDNRLKDSFIKRISNCINGKTKVKFKCLKNERHTWETIPNTFLRKNKISGCPFCAKNKKINNEIVDERLKEKQIKRLTDYKNATTPLKFQCLKDGYQWDALLNKITSVKNPCLECRKKEHIVIKNKYIKKEIRKKLNLTNEQVDKRLEGRNIKRLTDYINGKTKVKFQCLICDHIWITTPNIVINNNHDAPSKCPKCTNHIKLNNDILDERLQKRDIKRIGNCENSKRKIKFKCLKCDRIWKASPNSICNSKSGCPICSLNKTEKYIKTLIEKYIKYSILIHHKYVNFHNRKYFPDFYLEIDNIKIIIEYNGKQHYEPVRFNSISLEKAKIKFEKQKTRDKNMRQYCKENGIILIEIPYKWTEFQIIEELKKISNLYNKVDQKCAV